MNSNLKKDSLTLKTFDRNLFKDLLRLNAIDLKDYLNLELKKINKELEFVGDIKNGDKPGYLFYKGKFPVMLLAHLDRKLGDLQGKISFRDIRIEFKNELQCESYRKCCNVFRYPCKVEVWSHEDGIAGDDRCGVFIILELIKKYDVSVLFTDREEKALFGREQFAFINRFHQYDEVKENDQQKLNKEFLKNGIKFMCQIDRGHNALLCEGKSSNNPFAKKLYSGPIDFELDSIDLEKYKAKKYTKKGLTSEIGLKEETIDTKDDNMKYSLLTLVGEIRRYFEDETCKDIEKILVESKDGIEKILEKCSTYNQIVNDVIVNKIFSSLYDVKRIKNEKEEEVILLKAPINNQCYEYIGQPNLVIEQDSDIKEVKDNKGKSFHADTYIFDSKPERELFLQALDDVDVAECYFTGMFINEKTGFAVPYIDPETNTLRNYYPDFIIKLVDGSYIIIEVKADFKVDDPVVKARANATKEIVTDKGMDYMLVESSRVEKERIKFALT